MDAKELQAIIEREKWDRFHAAGKASTPSASPDVGARLQKIVDDWKRRHPNGTPKATKRAPGAVLREAQQMAEAMRRARRGDVGEALGVERVEATNKLPPHIEYG